MLSHDINLPEWGPYTKWYAGISHIADREKGLRFDLSVFPGFYRRRIDVPNVMWESGFHPWESAADLGYYSMRYELEWKDRVYADVSFSKINENARLIRCQMVNNTDREANLVLHYMASLCFDTPGKNGGANGTEGPHNSFDVRAPGAITLHALDYSRMIYAKARPTDNLMPDGLCRGEIRGPDFVNGSALGRGGFGLDAGDMVSYRFTLASDTRDCVMRIRYFGSQGSARFKISGDFPDIPGTSRVLEMPHLTNENTAQNAASGAVSGAGLGAAQFAFFRFGDLKAGSYEIVMTSEGKGAAVFDSVIIGQEQIVFGAEYLPRKISHTPQILDGPFENSVILKYESSGRYYAIYWDYRDYVVRQILNSELDKFLRFYVHEHVNKILAGDGKGHFFNVFQRPIVIRQNSAESLYGIVLDAATAEEAAAQLRQLKKTCAEYEGIYNSAREGRFRFNAVPEGEPFRKSLELMAANCLENVVFPVYTRRKYIRHYTPGKWWDCLYTWDSGFTGIGLNVLDTGRAADCLNAYLTPEGDTHCAFIHHGSMVPVQFYLFMEIRNRTLDEELLRSCYPKLRQYYRFYAGKYGSSATLMPSGLLKTWDYFYNSGGWDDYPPQFYSHANGLTPNGVTPVINTAHAIRCARLLVMMARHIGGLDSDIAGYDADINSFTQALQTHSWDEDSGYFGYVLHDENGRPKGLLRHEGGQNFNMGLDGVQPIIGGTLAAAQEERLIAHIIDPRELWTDIGLSTVDRSAKYYRKDGYWNGAVWMPHQWFILKSMLDLGRGDIAFKIADTALNVWKTETDYTYNCYEHFIVASGRGAGWHQFGGLSSPVLYWFQAYYVPGNLTCGYDVWIDSIEFSAGNDSLSARLRLYGASRPATCVIARMAAGNEYAASFNGAELAINNRVNGAVEIIIPTSVREGTLKVYRKTHL